GELAHAQTQAVYAVVRLAVVAERARKVHDLRALRDEHPTLAGRHRLGRVEGPEPDVAPAARATAVPVGAVSVRAVLDQEDIVVGTPGGDAVRVEGDVPADVDEDNRARAVLLGLYDEVVERHAEVFAIAVDELDPRACRERGERRRHERVRRAEDGCAAD